MRCPVTVVTADGGPKQPPHARLVAGVSSAAHDIAVMIPKSSRMRISSISPKENAQSLGSTA
jgi:hypothetical protein